MQILALQGSPREKGNTATLLNSYLKGIKDANIQDSDGNEIEVINLDNMNIKPCNGCGACKKLKDRHCVINDDMTALYSRFINSDLVIFASPVYWWSVSAQMKLFIDRLYALIWDDKKMCFVAKIIVIILTFGDEEPCAGADLTVKMFWEIARYTEMHIAGVIRYCSEGRHVSRCPEKLKEAYEMGLGLKNSER
jgi:multimeric flavodoxin WrbA